MLKYKVGDRVLAKKPHYGEPSLATIMAVVDDDGDMLPYGVKYDNNVGGHDLNGTVPDGYGWWCSRSGIAGYADELEDIEAEDISKLFEEDCYEP